LAGGGGASATSASEVAISAGSVLVTGPVTATGPVTTTGGGGGGGNNANAGSTTLDKKDLGVILNAEAGP